MSEHPQQQRRSPDGGFTLVEILVVIVVIGILAVVVVFSVRGFADRGEESSCEYDERVLLRAGATYMAEHSVDAIPATGTGVERFERTLVDAELLGETSSYHDVEEDGTIVSAGDPCP